MAAEPQPLVVNKQTDAVDRPDTDVPRVGGLVAEFEDVYRTHVSAVTSFFARRSRDPQTVADLTSDTFVEAMTSFHSFDPAKGAVRGWLFAIARRVYARHCERAAHRRDAAARDAGRRSLDPDQIDELLRRIDAERSGRLLLDRLSRLGPVERAAVELVDLSGLTPKEAAAALGVTSGALRVRLFRARARLRKEETDD
jgi:RNA polymerase sigma factor (sigma-70 family)